MVATDVNQRALRIARFNAALNEVADRVDVRDGSFFEPVAGEQFDLIATNPPFVISPATGERLVYRDSGLPGDRVVEHIVRNAPDHLTEGGWCQVLANWVVPAGGAWQERIAGWVPEGCDTFVVQREVIDPAAYVELWLKDAGLHGTSDYLVRYDTWLSWFEDQGIEAIGFGWINLRRSGGSAAEFLEWPYDVEQPIAPAIRDWGRAVDATVDLDSHLVARVDVRQETLGAPGEADPETVVLRQQRGLRRARQADTVEAALVGRVRRRPQRRPDPGRGQPAARPRPAADPGDLPPGGARAGRRGLPDYFLNARPGWTRLSAPRRSGRSGP